MTESRTYAPPPDPTPDPPPDPTRASTQDPTPDPTRDPTPDPTRDPTRPSTRAQPVWKAVVVGLLVVLGTPASAVAGFAAVVIGSGCFISCGAGNPVGGFLLGALAVALLTAGPSLAFLLYRRWAPVGWAVLGVVGTVLTAVAVLHG